MQTTLTQRKPFTIEDAPVSEDLKPISNDHRTVGVFAYMSMWLGDGFNIGNITLGSSLVVAGTATMSLTQTLVAAAIAIFIISVIFALNDRFGYLTGAPYVMQLRLSFGKTGAKFASLLRGIPAIIWFGFQSWTGALALNQIAKIMTGGSFNNTAICFVIMQVVQVLIALKGFKSIKVVTSIISVIVMIALFGVFVLLITQHGTVIQSKLINVHGSWGLTFFSFIVAFLGNYTAIFESAADYSRELKPNLSNKYRGFLYFLPITVAYGITIVTGAMLAAVTGISSPVNAMSHIFNNNLITLFVSGFIILGVITTNSVANIMPPTYILTSLLKMPQKWAIAIVGLLAACSFPWLLVQDSSSAGLALFIRSYSVFLGPMTAIILVEYYIERHQSINLETLYNDNKQQAVKWNAPIALAIGAIVALMQVDLSWIIGFVVGGIAYLVLNRIRKEKRDLPENEQIEQIDLE
ncbi:NCS1 family transporter [Liquorilactobacillus uvarum]|uniref:Permease n=1 Tax=Liquorilactobacillus uvarum DSM 19971 TaxID=1423812 RepID=A0A0R1Q3N2_9LACO|nr:NCS1 family transporter [Liquorilactobacillus uvarum]KRL39004.1 permease [Liquorilactobacillus uvarum DSM 19971]